MLNHECNKQEIFGKFRDFEKKGKFSFVFFVVVFSWRIALFMVPFGLLSFSLV